MVKVPRCAATVVAAHAAAIGADPTQCTSLIAPERGNIVGTQPFCGGEDVQSLPRSPVSSEAPAVSANQISLPSVHSAGGEERVI